MKTVRNIIGLVVSGLLQALIVAGMAHAYDVSGTVAYTGSQTGRVFIMVPNTPYGPLGTSVVFDGLSSSIAFSIRGIPSGNYTVDAFLDSSGIAVKYASAPTGTIGLSITNQNVTGLNITLTDSAPQDPNSALPLNVSVLHGSSANLITWESTSNSTGTMPIPADLYNIYWSTDPDVMGTYLVNGGSLSGIPASHDDNTFIHTGLGVKSYFYAMKSIVKGSLSTSYSSSTGTTPGAGHTITGSLSLLDGNPLGKPLYVVAVPNNGKPASFAALTTTATSTQPFSIAGLPEGDYWIYPIFDMNANGLIDAGDIMPGDSQVGLAHVEGGDVNIGTIAFFSSNIDGGVVTEHWIDGLGHNSYNLIFKMRRSVKIPVAVAFIGGTNMPGIIDAGMNNGGGLYNSTAVPWIPRVGDSYSFDVTYADNTTETITEQVTGVLNSFSSPVSPLGGLPYAAGMPVFSWISPSSPPEEPYRYRISLWGNDSTVSWSPRDDMLSSQLFADYNYDGSASQSSLNDNQTYTWSIFVLDKYGNMARNQTGFTFKGAISGTVTNSTGTGIGGVRVSIYNSSTNAQVGQVHVTKNSGKYSVQGLSNGTYKVYFDGISAGYLDQWYDNQNPVTVIDHSTTTADAQLSQGGSISGTVTNSLAEGIYNAQVRIFDASGTQVVSAQTTSLGNYLIGGLTTGTYKVCIGNVRGMGYVPRCYNDKVYDTLNADNVAVTIGSDTSGINVVLPTGGIISGTVTNDSAGISGVTVIIYNAANSTQLSSVTTDADGKYVAAGYATGNYKVCYDGSVAGYVPQCFDNRPFNVSSADAVAVTAPNATPNINATLVFGGSISGSVSYSGGSNGRIYINVNYSGGGTTPWGTSIAGPGAFTVRGVQSGTYTLSAYMDNLDTGIRNMSNPIGMSTAFTIGTTSMVTGLSVTLMDPAPVTPITPTSLAVFPGEQSAFIAWDANYIQDIESATAYKVYWGTDPNASNLTPYTVIADENGFKIQSDLMNGDEYYYKISALYGTSESPVSAVEGPITIGATVGQYAVSGAINVPVAPTGPLYVALYGDSGLYFTRIATPHIGSQSYSISGVPSDTYSVFSLVDMNSNGIADIGDIVYDTSSRIIVNDANETLDLTLWADNAFADVMTNHWASGTTNIYNVGLHVSGGKKRPVKVTAVSGPYITVPADIGISWNEFDGWFYTATTRPNTGDTYGFAVTYSDNTTEALQASVTGVLDSFPILVSPIGDVASGPTPTFTWQAPASPPAEPYTYDLTVWANDTSWYLSDLPSSKLSAVYNADGTATPPGLSNGQAYWWRVSLRDSSGNSAQSMANFRLVGAILSGKVTDSQNNGIQNVYVYLYDMNNSYISSKVTDSNGNYTMSVMSAGSYKVRFSGTNVGYLDEWYNDKADFASADTVTFAINTTTQINTVLTKGGIVSGRVTDPQNNGIQYVYVYLYDSNNNYITSKVTDATGNYSIIGLLAGSYKVRFVGSSAGYGDEWYNDKSDVVSADTVAVALSAATQVNATLDKLGVISGKVTDSQNNGIQNVYVSLYDMNNSYLFYNATDSAGNYTIIGLPAGSYKVRFSGSNMGYLEEWYNDKADFASADTVLVALINRLIIKWT